MNALWALDEADKLMAADGVSQDQRPYRAAEYVRRVIAGDRATPDAAPMTDAAVATEDAPANDAAAPVAAPLRDPWVAALASINGDNVAPAPATDDAPVVSPDVAAAQAAGDVWTKALAKVNASVRQV